MKETAKGSAREATILVIVYEQIIRHILARMLTAKGHKVVTCSVGFDGIREFEKGKGKFDLVMIDIILPDVNGLDVGKRIKKISQETPVVLIKGWGRDLDKEETKKSGIDLIMSKPLYMDKTLRLVEDAMLTDGR